jgi:hypothetical protein
VAAPVLPALSCRLVDRVEPTAEEESATDGPSLVTRPVLRPGPSGSVHIAAPLSVLPMAYVSVGRMQVFVDYEFRDRARFFLDAHISVSTGVWRIRRPGDPEDQPVTPGDLLREYEELDIAEWDPTTEPTLGDVRLLRGGPTPVTIDFSCTPMEGSGGWYSAGPLRILRCDPALGDACREDFVEVGVGRRQPVRGCADPGVVARFVTWACTE